MMNLGGKGNMNMKKILVEVNQEKRTPSKSSKDKTKIQRHILEWWDNWGKTMMMEIKHLRKEQKKPWIPIDGRVKTENEKLRVEIKQLNENLDKIRIE